MTMCAEDDCNHFRGEDGIVKVVFCYFIFQIIVHIDIVARINTAAKKERCRPEIKRRDRNPFD